jgi:hypothetical protein
MAQEIEQVVPARHARDLTEQRVNYESIGLKLMTWDNWLATEADGARSHQADGRGLPVVAFRRCAAGPKPGGFSG